MLHLAVDVESAALRMTTSLTVLLPQAGDAADWGAPEPGPDGPPVLYLLHGLSDDASAWTRFTSIERYAAAAGLAVVMPEVGRSMYADAPGGAAYFSYVADELPQLVAGAFRVSTRRADTFVAGLSMGGYGALKLALRRPERYAAAAALSAVVDVRAVESGDRFTPPSWRRCSARPAAGSAASTTSSTCCAPPPRPGPTCPPSTCPAASRTA